MPRALDGEVRDIGDTNSPIVMQVDGCTTLQSCISRWSNQSLRHALNEVPKILCVQLADSHRQEGGSGKIFIPSSQVPL